MVPEHNLDATLWASSPAKPFSLRKRSALLSSGDSPLWKRAPCNLCRLLLPLAVPFLSRLQICVWAVICPDNAVAAI